MNAYKITLQKIRQLIRPRGFFLAIYATGRAPHFAWKMRNGRTLYSHFFGNIIFTNFAHYIKDVLGLYLYGQKCILGVNLVSDAYKTNMLLYSVTLNKYQMDDVSCVECHTRLILK